jgi:N-methylhydantoinase A/oxoprolinase/acetone carboxylase beta subunit
VPEHYLLGIDTGGTFTDAVLLDTNKQVIAAAKSLTTRFDLAVGIGGALDQLPQAALERVALVSLSTTLTTNSVVEGKGSPVCMLLAGYDAAQIKASGMVELLGAEAICSLPGGHDAGGHPMAALDEAASKAAILKHAPRVSAFGISASFAVRNPQHELQLRAWVSELCDKPVTCGHELASSLGAPRRALTVALNARMVSHVKALIDSVTHTLHARQIDAPLMIVKGDGSLINAHSALERPVGTVLSGPAASVIGACTLSGTQNAIVADMGGTTTDIAVVRNGQPELSVDGALIGDWRPMVEAVKVYSIGLGGDSEVRFLGGKGLAIGPRRVVPISLLAHQHPEVLPVLERQQNESPHGSQIRFALRLQSDAAHISRLPNDELRAWEWLAQGPVDLERSNIEDRPLSRALARLERKGLAIYSGFTPSDAAHVLGMASHWSQPAAEMAARIWARQMRYLYGLGTWTLGDAVAPSRQVVDLVLSTICQKLIEAGLNDAGQMHEDRASTMAALLTHMALQGRSAATSEPATAADSRPLSGPHASAPSSVFSLRFAPDMPLVAVGAPAASYYPAVADALGMPLVVPRYAEVANAVGAVLGQVAQRIHITVTQPVRGTFRVFAKEGPKDFAGVEAAIAHAKELAATEATHNALNAGADRVQVAFSQRDNMVNNDIDGAMFFEAIVTATASGAPRMGKHAHADGSAKTGAIETTAQQLASTLAEHGLQLRGHFVPAESDALPALPNGARAAMVYMVGVVGSGFWPHFKASTFYSDGLPDPLDRWSRSLGQELAARFGGLALYPFDGPPYHPFQQWADRCEPTQPSRMLLRIHPAHGLWHAYRFVLAVPQEPGCAPIAPAVTTAAIDSPTMATGTPLSSSAPQSPAPDLCATCSGQPCLQACPVGAYTGTTFVLQACADHLHTPAGQNCMEQGCQARAACPVAAHLRYTPEHAAFHMQAFARSHSPDAPRS